MDMKKIIFAIFLSMVFSGTVTAAFWKRKKSASPVEVISPQVSAQNSLPSESTASSSVEVDVPAPVENSSNGSIGIVTTRSSVEPLVVPSSLANKTAQEAPSLTKKSDDAIVSSASLGFGIGLGSSLGAKVGTELVAPVVVAGAQGAYDVAKKTYSTFSDLDYENGVDRIRRAYGRVDALVEKAIAAMPNPRDIDIRAITRAANSIKDSLSSAIDRMTPDNTKEVLDFAGKAFKGFSRMVLNIIKA
jgi:hypothetical protein